MKMSQYLLVADRGLLNMLIMNVILFYVIACYTLSLTDLLNTGHRLDKCKVIAWLGMPILLPFIAFDSVKDKGDNIRRILLGVFLVLLLGALHIQTSRLEESNEELENKVYLLEYEVSALKSEDARLMGLISRQQELIATRGLE